MSSPLLRTLIVTVIIVILASALAFAGSANGQQISDIPIFALCVFLAFAINWVVYVPAMLNQTEKYFDLTGAISNITVPLVAVLLSPVKDTRSWLLFVLIAIWAGRLGIFLFQRIQTAGHDTRFEEIKKNPFRFFITWSLQGLWVSFTLAAALAAITAVERRPLGVWAILGLLVWLAGFAIEVAADRQKSRFRQEAANQDKFIQSGLWAWSRHPNYFGEIVLWIGIAIIALPVLSGWQWGTLISPLFVIVLLTRISGIPLLEAKADKKWGGEPAYEVYKTQTPVLIPRPPRRP
ncbi:MAG: DUF1295 domain-containing protein [Anaerolineales bacterium]|nr:DUF1295 domain-containing protein [Anaerolineales bacterium]